MDNPIYNEISETIREFQDREILKNSQIESYKKILLKLLSEEENLEAREAEMKSREKMLEAREENLGARESEMKSREEMLEAKEEIKAREMKTKAPSSIVPSVKKSGRYMFSGGTRRLKRQKMKKTKRHM